MSRYTHGHVVDDDFEVRVLLDEWDEVGHTSDWCENGHRDFELSASSPEWRHERAANPIVVWRGGGAEADAVEAVDFGEAAELIGRGRVLRVDAANAFEGAWVTLEHTGEIPVVPAVVNDLDENGAEDLVRLHELEELVHGRVFCGRVGSGGEGKCGIMLPDVHVGVDEWRGRGWRWNGSEGCGDGCEEAAATPHSLDFRSCARLRMGAIGLHGASWLRGEGPR
jgi:hypothetical protein